VAGRPASLTALGPILSLAPQESFGIAEATGPERLPIRRHSLIVSGLSPKPEVIMGYGPLGAMGGPQECSSGSGTSGLAERLAEVSEQLVVMVISEQVPDADDERDRPFDDAEQGEGGDAAVEGQPVR
jgi:hypothetical protein